MKAFDPNYKLLDEMYQDDYYPAFLVDKVKDELQKVHHLGKGQFGWVGSRKKFRRNIRAYIVPVELHEKCHNAMVAAVLVRQRRFDGGFGLLRQFLRLIQHFSHRIHGSRIAGQFFLYIEDKG